MKKEKNYCGANNVFSVPNVIFGAKINDACMEHDAKYRTGGTKEDRLKADNEFLFDMLASGCNKFIAYCYYYAVRGYGWLCWWDGKQ